MKVILDYELRMVDFQEKEMPEGEIIGMERLVNTLVVWVKCNKEYKTVKRCFKLIKSGETIDNFKHIYTHIGTYTGVCAWHLFEIT